MQAAVCRHYGDPDVVQIETLPTPTPAPFQILVQVYASTVSAADMRIRSLTMPTGFGWLARFIFGLKRPRQPILGTELAGKVVAVGSKCKQFTVGQMVVAFPAATMGAHAEYIVMQEDGPIVPMPAGMEPSEAAALCFGGTTALHYLRTLMKMQPGEHLLIVGGSGAVGTAAIQIAKLLQAKVTAVASTPNLALLRSLGADDVLDYKTANWWPAEQRYDAILDTVGQLSWPAYRSIVRKGGRIGLVAANLPQMLAALAGAATSGVQCFIGPAPEKRSDLSQLCQWAAEQRFRPSIEATYPLQAIAKAHAHVDTGRKRGNVVIQMPIALAAASVPA